MIDKKSFVNFITEYKKFDEAVIRIGEAISGNSRYSLNLFECDWYNSVDLMLNIFIESHFTELGEDLIFWWMFEDVDKKITQEVDPDLFTGKSEIEYDVNELDDLWEYLIKYKEDYLKNES